LHFSKRAIEIATEFTAAGGCCRGLGPNHERSTTGKLIDMGYQQMA